MVISLFLLVSCAKKAVNTPEHFNKVDQILWVIEDMDNAISNWNNLGFTQILDLDTVTAELKNAGESILLKIAKANLGGAHISWIQPLEDNSVFARFHSHYGDGAMSLVHQFENVEVLNLEVARLSEMEVGILEKISISTNRGDIVYILMDTWKKGKYILGYTYGDTDDQIFENLGAENLHDMKINQYAFAILDPEPVSEFWTWLGQPEFQINYPELGNMHYYGEPTDHELIQGWQRHGTVSYEWCIPVTPPIVYDDHIKNHGEGIHHLAFSVDDMDRVLDDYLSRGYVNSMGGTWGEDGKPGSGRYEYIDLEDAGGVTMELLWSYKE